MTKIDLENNEKLQPASLGATKLFDGIPFNLVRQLLEDCKVVTLEPEDVLIRPREENHFLYLLLEGSMRVQLDTADKVTFPIEAGECIGEMSIIERSPTSAFVIANETSTLIEMPENVFWEQYVHFPGAVGNLLQVLVGRMHYNNEEIIRTAEQRIEFEHMQKEMENAGKIQLGILPIDPLFPNHPQVDVYAAMDPATEVGGDFYDAFALDEDHIYVAIGDVSGKGMAAALFMMQCVSLLRMSMFNEMRVDLVIPEINNVLTESIDGQLFLTLFAAVINVRTGEMEYMNGGHNPPFIMRAGSDFEMLPMPKGTLMGIMPDTHYEVARITLAPGDVLVIYTDGVTEAESTDGGFYEEAPAMAVLCQHKDADMRTLLTKLKDDVDRFSKGHKQSDDITILALRYLGDQ